MRRQPPSPPTAVTDATQPPSSSLLAALPDEEPISPAQIGSILAIGVVALVGLNLVGLLLPALAEEGRLSTSGIGLAAMVEALSSALVTGLAGGPAASSAA